jgi:2-polyprenyl-6-methoxyphenol hydroxylase-like FAD-dependent oxidoreductase
MTPFSGKGANAAMRDALELANAILECLKAGRSLDDAVCQYEDEMFPRAHKVQKFTMVRMKFST